MSHYLALVLGILCAGLGGELFVRGTVGLARWARISPAIAGATVAAFATSSPEMSVAIVAAFTGAPAISFGNVLGSNVVNVALIFGLMLLIGPLCRTRREVKRDFSVALLAPIVVGVVSFDGVVSRIDGLILLGLFLAWLIGTILEARQQRSAAVAVLGEKRRWLAGLLVAIGLALLFAAGELIVTGASGIGRLLGLDNFIIGAVIVSIGTTVPEMATAVISKMRKHEEVGFGTIFGSNIFNGLFILGLVAVISPIAVPWREVLPVVLFGIVTVAVILPPRHACIQRWRGAVLLGLYAAYLAATIVQEQR